jgi:hypothetical protein
MTTQHQIFAPTSKLQMAGTVLMDEALVTDTRAHLTPAQHVENKLVSLLRRNPLLLSQSVLLTGSMRRRS